MAATANRTTAEVLKRTLPAHARRAIIDAAPSGISVGNPALKPSTPQPELDPRYQAALDFLLDEVGIRPYEPTEATKAVKRTRYVSGGDCPRDSSASIVTSGRAAERVAEPGRRREGRLFEEYLPRLTEAPSLLEFAALAAQLERELGRTPVPREVVLEQREVHTRFASYAPEKRNGRRYSDPVQSERRTADPVRLDVEDCRKRSSCAPSQITDAGWGKLHGEGLSAIASATGISRSTAGAILGG